MSRVMEMVIEADRSSLTVTSVKKWMLPEGTRSPRTVETMANMFLQAHGEKPIMTVMEE